MTPKIPIVGAGGGDVPDTEKRQLSEGRRWRQLSFPLEIILSFGLKQDSHNHEDPKQTHQSNAHPLRKPFKEITSQSYGKDCFIQVQEEPRDSLTSPSANELFPHKLSILYSMCRNKDFVIGGAISFLGINVKVPASFGSLGTRQSRSGDETFHEWTKVLI